jgi:hypothetical protein
VGGLLTEAQRHEAKIHRVRSLVPVRDWRMLVYYAAGERKYGERFWISEEIKVEKRRRYCDEVEQMRHRPFDEQVDHMRSFWQEYQEINDEWLPEDPVFTGTRLGATLSTTADLWANTVGASGQHRILESLVGGEAAAAAVARVVINRPSGAGVTPTNQTPEKMSTRSPAAVSTFVTAWATNPTLSTNDLITHAFNAFGGNDRWVPQPGEEIYQVNGESVSCRSRSGTSVVSAHDIWEEL